MLTRRKLIFQFLKISDAMGRWIDDAIYPKEKEKEKENYEQKSQTHIKEV